MGDHFLPLPLTDRSVRLCVDMRRIFAAEGPWPTPWMDKVLPVVTALASRHSERAVFTRFSARASRPNAWHVATLLRAPARRDSRSSLSRALGGKTRAARVNSQWKSTATERTR
jgi:hypothetical protein